jgi:hypothetical protein
MLPVVLLVPLWEQDYIEMYSWRHVAPCEIRTYILTGNFTNCALASHT